MCKVMHFFLSIILLSVIELSAEPRGMIQVSIERSPSTMIEADRIQQQAVLAQVGIDRSPSESRDMTDFFRHIKECVHAKDQATPGSDLCLDFNTKLLGLFQRLEHSSDSVRSQWAASFQRTMGELARQYQIRRLSLTYTHFGQLPFVSYLVAPLIPYLNSLHIQPLVEGTVFTRN